MRPTGSLRVREFTVLSFDGQPATVTEHQDYIDTRAACGGLQRALFPRTYRIAGQLVRKLRDRFEDPRTRQTWKLA